MAEADRDAEVIAELAARLEADEPPSAIVRWLGRQRGDDPPSPVRTLADVRPLLRCGIPDLKELGDWVGFGRGGDRPDADFDEVVRRIRRQHAPGGPADRARRSRLAGAIQEIRRHDTDRLEVDEVARRLRATGVSLPQVCEELDDLLGSDLDVHRLADHLGLLPFGLPPTDAAQGHWLAELRRLVG